MSGKSQPKSLYAQLHKASIPAWLEVMLVMLGGSLAMVLHARLRVPLNIPGHHGLEFMMIFVLIRLRSNLKYAATVASAGVGIILFFPIFKGVDPLWGINYMLPGLFLDPAYLLIKGRKYQVVFLALIAGLCYMTIPFTRIIVSVVSGIAYPAVLKHGIVQVLGFFFAFGVMGGFLGQAIEGLTKIPGRKK